MAWEVKQRESGSVKIVEAIGRIEMGEGSDVLEETLHKLIEEGHNSLLLECSRVDSIDSSGIGGLVRCLNTLHKRGGKLMLLKPSDVMRAALEFLGLIKILKSFDDEDTALASFSNPA